MFHAHAESFIVSRQVKSLCICYQTLTFGMNSALLFPDCQFIKQMTHFFATKIKINSKQDNEE